MFDSNVMIEKLIAGDEAALVQMVKDALDGGTQAKEILNQGLIAGMDIVGEKMENEDMFIPEVLMAAKAMGACVVILKPLLSEEDNLSRGTVVIGTVKGDLHDI
jgi:5-methyltetrahydrofolate--homocysteine methyltransferase